MKTASKLAAESSRPLRVLAGLYQGLGDEKLAVEHGRKAVQVEPGDMQARFLLGRIYGQYGRREEAIRAYQDVLAIDPDHGAAKTALSRFLKPE